ncbi:EAL domain-containing protein [Azoarcus sp. DN11]|uniref:two-component system response regulator n=1 Tax=Azoarcus sp. DN11 TaxID=356837 RepID=UPI000EAD283E|nr:EAL domain-containing protein [Azoarcus sp. DN11]AYH43885.1 diguanylate cyclase [Azoarcus sp. DN11]
MAGQPLKVLIVEDVEDDALLIVRELRRGGYDPLPTRVETAPAMQAALGGGGTFDLVISDYTLPHFSGPSALELFNRCGCDLPFIMVSGTIGEETAVRLLKAGAHDFILKSNFARLVPAVERELREVAVRRARRLAEARLRESEERYALAAQGANDGLWDWDLRSGCVYYSPRWKSMLGYAGDEIGDGIEEWISRVHEEDRPGVEARLQAHLSGATAHFESEHRMRNQRNELLWMLTRGLAVRDEAGQPYRIAGSQTDITERKLAEERLRFQALHDALTGLPNRTLFMERLHCALAGAGGCHFAVMLVDLDRYKIITDSFGHNVGDALVLAVARALKARIGPRDTVARLGGDEFALLVEGMSSTDAAAAFARDFQASLARQLSIDGHEVFTSASIGIVMGPGDYAMPEEMLRDADTANQRAKAQGKGRCQVFDTTMHTFAVNQLGLETDLRRAQERDELVLYYQPLVNLASGEIESFEALLRWRHPVRGLVSPTEFIPIAEDTGLIVPIGRWALQEACRQISAWQAQFPQRRPQVSVNVSAVQFAQPDLADAVLQSLTEARLEARYLKLEITESVLMDGSDAVRAVLERLQGEQIKFLMDDFGTGYSSLSYLHRFPLDILKIDASFVQRMDIEARHDEIVQAIVALARSLNMDVVAEGLETPTTLARLRELNVAFGQGFLFSRPLDAESAGRLLASGRRWNGAKASHGASAR